MFWDCQTLRSKCILRVKAAQHCIHPAGTAAGFAGPGSQVLAGAKAGKAVSLLHRARL